MGAGIHQVKLCPKMSGPSFSQESDVHLHSACKTSLRGGSDRGMRRQVRMTRVDQEGLSAQLLVLSQGSLLLSGPGLSRQS